MQPGLKSVAADIRGLEAAIVTVIPDNLLYDAWSRNDRVQDADEAATYFGDLVRIHFGALQSVGVERGNIQLTIESGDAIILVRNIRGNYVITLVFQDDVPLGLMRVHTQRLIEHVASTLPAFDGDEGSLPFQPKDAPKPTDIVDTAPHAPDGFARAQADDHADDRLTPAGPAVTPAADDAQATARTDGAHDDTQPSDTQPGDTSDADPPEDEPTYHGYVYARDRDRLEAERAAADAKRRAELAEGGHYAEEDEARATHDAAPTAPVDALRMDDEGGVFPVESLHTDTTPATTPAERPLPLAAQEHAMANEGGIPMPLSETAIKEICDETDREIEPLPRDPESLVEAMHEHAETLTRSDVTAGETVRTGFAPSHAEQARRLLLAEQEHRMANEGGIPLPLSKPAIQEVRDVIGKPDLEVLPRHPDHHHRPGDENDESDEDSENNEAARETRRFMLAEQEHRMTSEGGVPLPLSEGAIKEARAVTGRDDIEVIDGNREALSAARRHKVDAPANHDGPRDLNFDRRALTPLQPTPQALDVLTDADTFAPDWAEAQEQPATPPGDPSAARSRAEAIILYVTANTATPQNVGARLAVHSRIALDEIRTPGDLDAEQTERLEDAAKAILGVSKLPF